MQAIILQVLTSRIEIAIEQLQRNQSLPALNTLKGALLELEKVAREAAE